LGKVIEKDVKKGDSVQFDMFQERDFIEKAK
jgi:hypothetical protein